MKNCIFSPVCQIAQSNNDNTLYEQEFNIVSNERLSNRKLFAKTNGNFPTCGVVCPMWSLSKYLMDKNDLYGTNVLSMATRSNMQQCQKLFETTFNDDDCCVTCIPKTLSCLDTANLLTYYGICTTWKYSVRYITVYNFNFINYLDCERASWSTSIGEVSPELTFMRNLINSKFEDYTARNILIISGIEYTNFKDTESSLLMKILGIRKSKRLPTIIVCPDPSYNLMGEGFLFNRLVSILEEHKENCL